MRILRNVIDWVNVRNGKLGLEIAANFDKKLIDFLSYFMILWYFHTVRSITMTNFTV